MKKPGLLEALQLAKPALGGNDALLPVLSHFVFAPDAVLAFNGTTAIMVDEPTGLKCALHGETLLGLMQAVPQDAVQIKVGKEAQLKMRNGWAKIPTMDTDSMPFELPNEDPKVELPLAPLLSGIERCMLSVGADSVKPEFAGVTLVCGKEGVRLYSTDNRSASRFIPTGRFGKVPALRTCLPAESCQRLLKLAADVGMDGAKLLVCDTVAIAILGRATLAARLLPGSDLYEKIFAEHFDTADVQPLPEGFEAEVTKANVLQAREAVKLATFTHNADVLSVHATGALGNMQGSLTVDKRKGSASVSADPEMVLRVLPHVAAFAVQDKRSLVLSGGGFAHIISHRADAAPAAAPKAKVQQDVDTEEDVPY